MRLTIQIDNPIEAQQLLRAVKNLNLKSANVVVEKQVEVDTLNAIHRPIQKRLDLDALKKAKNYRGVNRKRFDQLAQEINITEPIDLLLAQLKR